MLSRPVNQPVLQVDKTKTTLSSQPTNLPPTRQPLTNDLKINEEYKQKLVEKTADSRPTAAIIPSTTRISRYDNSTTSSMVRSIESKMGIPYRYGSSGPNRYDCSGFVWSVFGESGMGFERQSARTLWAFSMPVEEADKYKFGTLVFFNGLGHMGIVADANGFYHASSSKGITYSPFKGYWEKRIVGFRKYVSPVTVSTAGK
ncbi:MAG: C40 family peptidase [Pyrinomonadaceae bacterium]